MCPRISRYGVITLWLGPGVGPPESGVLTVWGIFRRFQSFLFYLERFHLLAFLGKHFKQEPFLGWNGVVGGAGVEIGNSTCKVIIQDKCEDLRRKRREQPAR